MQMVALGAGEDGQCVAAGQPPCPMGCVAAWGLQRAGRGHLVARGDAALLARRKEVLVNAVGTRAGWCHAGRVLPADLRGGRQATGSCDKLPKRGSEDKQLMLL